LHVSWFKCNVRVDAGAVISDGHHSGAERGSQWRFSS
jgi:hypothetical protein